MARKLKLIILICKRCGHSWTPRITDPVVCPKCHSARWQEKKGDGSGQ